MRINVKAFSLTCALFWGFGLLFITWWIILFDGQSETVTLIGKVYRGHSITPVGSLIGFLWGFFDGLIGGAVFAWLYNLLAAKFTSGKQ
ncbi:MAG: hypothetical protein E4H13_09165 [Calditrichales bacterium]|nr:MAG: hypothetical protein E4H13_09165 [Calditrichales bacterium]